MEIGAREKTKRNDNFPSDFSSVDCAFFFFLFLGRQSPVVCFFWRDVVKIQNHRSVSFSEAWWWRSLSTYWYRSSDEELLFRWKLWARDEAKKKKKNCRRNSTRHSNLKKIIHVEAVGTNSKKKLCVYLKTTHNPLTHLVCLAGRFLYSISFVPHSPHTERMRLEETSSDLYILSSNEAPKCPVATYHKKKSKIIILNCDDNTPSSDDRSLQVLTLEKCSIDEYYFPPTHCVFPAHLSLNLQSSISSLFCGTPITRPSNSDISS